MEQIFSWIGSAGCILNFRFIKWEFKLSEVRYYCAGSILLFFSSTDIYMNIMNSWGTFEFANDMHATHRLFSIKITIKSGSKPNCMCAKGSVLWLRVASQLVDLVVIIWVNKLIYVWNMLKQFICAVLLHAVNIVKKTHNWNDFRSCASLRKLVS